MKARWYGLRKSKGKYVGFVDSDDWIDPCMYKMLMAVAKERDCDIVSMGYTIVFDGQQEMRMDEDTLVGYYEKGRNLDLFLSSMMYDVKRMKRGVQPSLCTKVIKRELLIQSFDRADLTITMGEDAAVFYSCCLSMKNIYIMQKYKYFYRVHDTSMCRSLSIDNFSEFYMFYKYMQKCILKYGNQYGLLDQLKQYVWTFLEQGINQVFHIVLKRSYVFPYAVIERGSNIILYGAGEVGKSYYDQIMGNRYCNIVLWADKNSNAGKGIIHPNHISRIDNIKILIAVKKRELADEIMTELLDSGISKDRLIWICPQEIPVI